MSSTRANTGASPTGITNTLTATAAPKGERETKERKVVETVDYRTSAGQGQQERKPVAVVHEFPTGEKDAGSDIPSMKQ